MGSQTVQGEVGNGQVGRGAPPRPGSWVITSKQVVIISSFQVNEGELGGDAIFVDSRFLVKMFSEKTGY